MTDRLDGLRARIDRFADERDWRQFHTPRNLVMALVGEVGELAGTMQWLTDDEVLRGLGEPELRRQVAYELADVLIYLVRLADVCDVDLLGEADAKIDRNEQRYPPQLARGRAAKYTHLHPSSPLAEPE